MIEKCENAPALASVVQALCHVPSLAEYMKQHHPDLNKKRLKACKITTEFAKVVEAGGTVNVCLEDMRDAIFAYQKRKVFGDALGTVQVVLAAIHDALELPNVVEGSLLLEQFPQHRKPDKYSLVTEIFGYLSVTAAEPKLEHNLPPPDETYYAPACLVIHILKTGEKLVEYPMNLVHKVNYVLFGVIARKDADFYVLHEGPVDGWLAADGEAAPRHISFNDVVTKDACVLLYKRTFNEQATV